MFNSTSIHVKLAQEAGFEWPYLPEPVDERDRKRGLLVTPEINVLLKGDSTEPWFNRGKATGLLYRFIKGGRLRVSRERGRAKADLRQMVDGDEVWEVCFRYGAFKSGARLLGRFKDKDLFLGTRLVRRRPWDSAELAEAVRVWKAMLPHSNPIRDRELSAYLSERYNEVPIR